MMTLQEVMQEYPTLGTIGFSRHIHAESIGQERAELAAAESKYIRVVEWLTANVTSSKPDEGKQVSVCQLCNLFGLGALQQGIMIAALENGQFAAEFGSRGVLYLWVSDDSPLLAALYAYEAKQRAELEATTSDVEMPF